MRATFRIDISPQLYCAASGSDRTTTRTPYRFCPRCGGALEQRLLKADRARAAGLHARAASCSTSIRRSPSARSSAPPTAGSCWCGARSSLATASGCSPAATSIAASRCTAAAIREAREESRPRRPARRPRQHLLVRRPRADHRRLRRDGARRRAVRRRRVPRGAAVRRRRDPLGRARVPQHDRGAARLSRRRTARSRAAPMPDRAVTPRLRLIVRPPPRRDALLYWPLPTNVRGSLARFSIRATYEEPRTVAVCLRDRRRRVRLPRLRAQEHADGPSRAASARSSATGPRPASSRRRAPAPISSGT